MMDNDVPYVKQQTVGTKKPNMTRARALIILLMARYRELEYELTLLEVHKLAYLLQEEGEDLKLNFVAHRFGPYATNIRFLLQVIEGHFIRGFGDDENPEQLIELMPEALQKAEQFLSADETSQSRLESVSQLIDGFETPYGMELLTTVHWVQNHEQKQAEEDILTCSYLFSDNTQSVGQCCFSSI